MQLLPTALLALSVLSPLHVAAATTNLSDLSEARDKAFTAWSRDSVGEGVEILSSAIRAAASELQGMGDSESAEQLAAELEYSLIRLYSLAENTRNSPFVLRQLEGVEIAPRHGGPYARLEWLRKDCIESLGVLVDWQFVGPFDNERGIGMENPLPVQSKPGAHSYDGKVRPVSWRRTPETPPRKGRLRFWQLLDPNTQVCVMARSWVNSTEAASRLLQLGFEDEVRVWLNGVPVFEALGVHDAKRDAFGVRLDLQAGWNELTVLVGARENTPSMTARITELETGAPLFLEQVNALPEGLELAVLQTGTPDAALRVVPPGARSSFATGGSGAELMARSLMESYFGAEPSANRPGRESAKSAVAKTPDSLEVRIHLATLLQESSKSEEQDVNAWLHALDDVLEIQADSPWAWRQKAYQAGWNQPTYSRALDFLEKALAANPTSIQALDMKILLLEYLEQEALANRIREELIEHPRIGVWPAIANSCANALFEAVPNRTDYDLAWYEASGDVSALKRWIWNESRTREPGGDWTIEEVLRLRVARTPWSVAARVEAANQHLGLSNYDRAMELLDEAGAIAPDSPVIPYWKARVHLQQGNTDRAIVALERELELDFTAEDERRLLEYLRSAGKAAFHEEYREPLTEVIQRVTIDAESAAALPSREVILRKVVVKVNPDGTAKRYYRLVERILSESGARDRDAIGFSSFPNQEIRVLQANVFDIQGQTRKARTGRSAGRMTVDLPPLSVGDVIDLEWRVDDVRQTFFGNYFGFNETFTSDPSVPVHESEIVILSPDEFPLQFHTRGDVTESTVSESEGGVTRRTWIKRAIRPITPERFMPPVEESLAAVQASSYESWEAFGAWWWNLIEEEIQVSPEMASKVAELTEGKDSRLEKLRAIYDFVVTDIRYNAWEFGVHGYQPYEAPVIFSRGFGDCKDKAILLRALLSEVDIESWPVLIRAEQRRLEEDQSLALVEHFNHCIAYIPQQDDLPEMFLDGTARHHPLEVLPVMDNGADVLVVQAQGVEQKTIPFASADKNHVHSEITIDVQESRGARVKLKRSSKGRFDPADRGRFTGSQEQRTEVAEAILVSMFGPIEGEVSAEFSDLEDLNSPVEIEFEADIKQVARPNEDGFELPTALSKLDLLRNLATESERATDLLVDVPRSSSTVIRYKLPPGATPRDVPEPVSLDAGDASYEWSAKIIEGGFEVHEQFQLRTNRVTPASYEAFRDLARRVDEVQNSMLEVEVKP